tara:strand:- start:118 stop:489 length:372 start_codon:yes stop_codon:yes gene_type:complete
MAVAAVAVKIKQAIQEALVAVVAEVNQNQEEVAKQALEIQEVHQAHGHGLAAEAARMVQAEALHSKEERLYPLLLKAQQVHHILVVVVAVVQEARLHQEQQLHPVVVVAAQVALYKEAVALLL